MKKKVVVIGGGNGSAILLNALKPMSGELEISAVISTSDTGGSSGVLRRLFDTLPPGDLLRAALALSPYDYKILRKIFYSNRFSGLIGFGNMAETVHGHNLGNLFLALVARQEGNFNAALRALEQAVEAVGHVYPASVVAGDLCAKLSDGTILTSEHDIDEPMHERNLTIQDIWLAEPAPAVNPEARRALLDADEIFFSPGDLYTSVVAALLPAGVGAAIAASSARLIYVVGCKYHRHGEAAPATLSGYVKVLEKHLPRPVDVIVYNAHNPSAAQNAYYAEKDWGMLELDIAALNDRNVIGADFEKPEGGLSPDKLAPLLSRIWKSERKNAPIATR